MPTLRLREFAPDAAARRCRPPFMLAFSTKAMAGALIDAAGMITAESLITTHHPAMSRDTTTLISARDGDYAVTRPERDAHAADSVHNHTRQTIMVNGEHEVPFTRRTPISPFREYSPYRRRQRTAAAKRGKANTQLDDANDNDDSTVRAKRAVPRRKTEETRFTLMRLLCRLSAPPTTAPACFVFRLMLAICY